MNTMQAVAAPRPVTIGDRDYLVGELTPRDWAKVQAWIASSIPGPLEALKSVLGNGSFSPHQERAMILVALKEQQAWPPAPRTADWFRALEHTDDKGRTGDNVCLHAILSKHHPELTQADIDAIADRMDATLTTLVMRLAFGQEPTDPKSSSATGTTPEA